MISVSRLLCLIGYHKRSRGRARRVEGGYQSRCRRCGAAMRKADDGSWQLDVPGQTPAEPHVRASEGG